LAILQVNVRPAARERKSLRSQWWEKEQTVTQRSDSDVLLQSKSTSIIKPFAEARHQFLIPTSSMQSITPVEDSSQTLAQPPDQPIVSFKPGSQQITWTLTPATPVGRALVSAVQRLNEAGCENARLDAQVLLAYVLGQERSWLFAHHDYPLNEAEAEQYTELVARRVCREPVAYLIGRREFYGMDFLVDQRVLIPRPETELLVDLALAQVSDRKDQIVVADVGTGSGAIAVTLAIHAPEVKLYGLDVSPAALAVAQRNQARLAPTSSITFLQSDLLEALPEPVDLIIANLPYVTADEYEQLDPDIRNYEPRLALEAGTQGLDVIERLLQQVNRHLKPKGAVLLEIGSHQGDAVIKLAKAMKPRPSYVGLRRDYSGHIRMVTLEF
jgi:release factor glutamine methyltransferase